MLLMIFTKDFEVADLHFLVNSDHIALFGWYKSAKVARRRLPIGMEFSAEQQLMGVV